LDDGFCFFWQKNIDNIAQFSGTNDLADEPDVGTGIEPREALRAALAALGEPYATEMAESAELSDSDRLSMLNGQSDDESKGTDDSSGKEGVKDSDQSPEIRAEDVDALLRIAEDVRSLKRASHAPR